VIEIHRIDTPNRSEDYIISGVTQNRHKESALLGFVRISPGSYWLLSRARGRRSGVYGGSGHYEDRKGNKEQRVMEGIVAVEEITAEEAECKIATQLGDGELDKCLL
jgi:hypothetical protein